MNQTDIAIRNHWFIFGDSTAHKKYSDGMIEQAYDKEDE